MGGISVIKGSDSLPLVLSVEPNNASAGKKTLSPELSLGLGRSLFSVNTRPFYSGGGGDSLFQRQQQIRRRQLLLRQKSSYLSSSGRASPLGQRSIGGRSSFGSRNSTQRPTSFVLPPIKPEERLFYKCKDCNRSFQHIQTLQAHTAQHLGK